MPSVRWSAIPWFAINVAQAVYTVVWTALWITVALVVRLFSGGTRLPLAMARRCWAPGLLWGGRMRLEIDGLENVEPETSYFFAANHQSIVDILALFYVLPVPLLFILKQELRRVPFLGWYVAAMGMIFLPRERRRQSLENLELCACRIAQGHSILLFPEGTRSRDGKIGTFKPGIFLPAIDTGVPVVPVVLDGPAEILPPGTFRVRPGTIRVVLGPPIPTADLERGDRRELADQARRWMIETRRSRRAGSYNLMGAARRPEPW